jgi:hypothetical protein
MPSWSLQGGRAHPVADSISPDRPWARVQQLDAERVVAEVAAETGTRLTLEGPCPGGEVGAAYVRWPDGHRAVLTWRPDIELAEVQRGPLAVVEALRAVGYPAPATELAAQIGASVVTVQELLPGAKIDYLDSASLDQALALNALQRGQLAQRADVPLMKLFLRGDGPGFCVHEPLRQFSRRSAALEQWIRSVGADHPDLLAGQDAMHCDFHPGNMLRADGAITGIVDWDGACRGDCRLDLVTLRFGVLPGQCDPGVEERLDSILDGLPDSILRPAWAHMSLRMADWAIRHFSAAEVDYWLDLAERRVS